LPWLDLLRGAAVLVMIETHVVNTFLAVSLREAGWFAVLNYINGLVAPSFLFIAGYVQGLERRKSPGKPINYVRRSWRLLGIGLLGYAMHFPVAEVAHRRWDEALRIGSQVDVLQCLALGLGLLLAVGWLTDRLGAKQKSEEARAKESTRFPSVVWALGVAAMAVGTVFAAPHVQGWVQGPVALRAWVNASSGSLFPLFPWIGFVFLGGLMGACPERPWLQRVAGMAGLTVLAWAFRDTQFSAVGPVFFLERAIWVLALAAFCEWNTHRPMPSAVLYAGKHSLKFYAVHLALITTLAGAGVPPLGFTWPLVLALMAGVMAVSFVTARFLDRLPEFIAEWRRSDEPRVAETDDLPSPIS
jgi:uncharacterized membrane protein